MARSERETQKSFAIEEVAQIMSWRGLVYHTLTVLYYYNTVDFLGYCNPQKTHEVQHLWATYVEEDELPVRTL